MHKHESGFVVLSSKDAFTNTIFLQGKPYQAGGFKPVGSPRIAPGAPSQFHPPAASAFMRQPQANSGAAFMQPSGGYPGMGQPPAPQPAAPPAPTGPPSNVNIVNVDTSKVGLCRFGLRT